MATGGPSACRFTPAGPAFDLFHGTNFDVPLWKRRRSVVTIHDLSALLHPEKHRSRLVRRARLRLPLVVRIADMIITPTESVKREVCHHLGVKPDKVTAIHSAARTSFRPMPFAQTAELRKRLGVEDDFLLFVGTLEPRKNLLTLLKAFEQIIRQSALRPQLVIAGGEGWLMDDMFAFIRKSGHQRTPALHRLPERRGTARALLFRVKFLSTRRSMKDSACRLWRRWPVARR